MQLINGTDLCSKTRKSLGSKRNMMNEGDMAIITRCFGKIDVRDWQEARAWYALIPQFTPIEKSMLVIHEVLGLLCYTLRT